MATEQLRAFLLKKSENVGNTVARWSTRCDEYLQAVDRLYNTIKNEYLAFPGSEELVKVERLEATMLKEPYLGSYPAPKLTLFVAAERVEFIPKGVVVANSAGRIDVVGHAGETTLSRIEGDQWEMIYARSPRLLTVPLTEKTFLDLLRRVMD